MIKAPTTVLVLTGVGFFFAGIRGKYSTAVPPGRSWRAGMGRWRSVVLRSHGTLIAVSCRPIEGDC
jgi:hypothetical protein